MSTSEKENETVISDETIREWRAGVLKRREELFRRNWKNKRPVLQQRSRRQELAFKFLLEWYEDFDEVVAREREKSRLDKLIFEGQDVNSPENQKK